MPDVGTLLWRRYLPESVAFVIAGALIGAAVPGARSLVSANLVLLVLVPGLVFDAAFDLPWPHLRPLAPALALLAGPGVLVSAGVVALALRALLGWPLELALVVGAITAATDPVAVVVTLTRMRLPHRLRTLVEGESLLNDGTGLVLAALAVTAATHVVTPAAALGTFVTVVGVSLAAGLALGAASTAVFGRIGRPRLVVAGTAVLAYGGYAAATALGLSGVLTTVVAAAVLGNLLRRDEPGRATAARLDRAWGTLALVLSALTFTAIGLVSDVPALGAALPAIAVGAGAALAARALIVYVPFALARPHVPLGWAHVVFWSGLRGAIALAAALALPPEFPSRGLIQEVTVGIVLVTLVAQGASAPLVIGWALHGERRDG